MAEEKTYVFGQDGASASVPAWMAYGNNGGWGNGLGGWGGGILGFFLGLLFGNGWGGFGGFGNGFGGGNGAGFLSNQMNNDSGRELLMNAITSQGEASRAAIQNLATSLGQDFNLVNGAVQTLQNSLSSLALQQAVSVPQIINSIQSGNSALAAQLSQCCCQAQLRTVEQTNTLSSGIAAASQKNSDAIADLKSSMISEFCAARERDMQEKIDGLLATNATLRGQIDNANQSNQIIGYINSVVAPIQTKVNEIASHQLPTVPVQYPQIQAINTTPYNGGIYGYGMINGGLVF